MEPVLFVVAFIAGFYFGLSMMAWVAVGSRADAHLELPPSDYGKEKW